MNRQERLLILLLVAVLLAGTVIRLTRSRPGLLPDEEKGSFHDPATVLPEQPETCETIVVHVTGAVLSSGVYSLPAGTRVADAVTAAGGLAPESDPERINLAAFLVDGQQIVIPTQNEMPGAGEHGPPHPVTPGQIPINTASRSELESLPGIGPVLAERIVAYRQMHGAFTSVDDLLNVSGIGEKKLGDIREMITLY
jgi:competence protein ComEA